MQTMIPQLEWIDKQQKSMVELLQEWCTINSSSDNLIGLDLMLASLEKEFAGLGGNLQHVVLPSRVAVDAAGLPILIKNGKALHIAKRMDAPVRVFLGGHMDTVFGIDHPFQKVERLSDNIMRGPGVADMKGGLVVMLTALKALEMHPLASRIGWEVVINPDEEVGSMGSEQLLIECAGRNDVGLLFEPAFSDGALVGARKGSANFTIVVRGKQAHAGRDFDKGRNAISALANYIVKAEKILHKEKGITLNFGHIAGGGPVNIVPDLAICRFNLRAENVIEFEQVQKELGILAQESDREGINMTLYLQSTRAPKPFDTKNQKLFEQLRVCAKEEGMDLRQRSSGGVCDGNIMSQAGLPIIDTLGVVGGEIHTDQEYVLLDSLTTRARLVARFLIQLAEAHNESIK